MSIKGPDESEPNKIPPEADLSKTGSTQNKPSSMGEKAEQIMFTGVKAVLHMMYDWADQLEKKVSDIKKAAAEADPNLDVSKTSESSRPTRSEGARLSPNAIDKPQYLDTAHLLENIVGLANNIDVVRASSKSLTLVNYNNDPEKVTNEISGKLQTILSGIKELDKGMKSFDALTSPFSQISDEKDSISQAHADLSSASGALADLKKVKNDVDQLMKGDTDTLEGGGGAAQSLRAIKDGLREIDSSLRSTTGPLKTMRENIASIANKLAANIHSKANPKLETDADTGTEPPSESVWGTAEYILLGVIAPEINSQLDKWNYILDLEVAIENECGPLVSYLNIITITRINPYQIEMSSLLALQSELASALPKLSSEIKQMEGVVHKYYDIFYAMSGPESQWTPKSLVSEFNAISEAIVSLSVMLGYVEVGYQNLDKIIDYPSAYLVATHTPKGGDCYKVNTAGAQLVSQFNDALSAFGGAAKSLGVNVAQQQSETQSTVMLLVVELKSYFACFTNVLASLTNTVNTISSNLS